jgi:hypothetical protein
MRMYLLLGISNCLSFGSFSFSFLSSSPSRLVLSLLFTFVRVELICRYIDLHVVVNDVNRNRIFFDKHIGRANIVVVHRLVNDD